MTVALVAEAVATVPSLDPAQGVLVIPHQHPLLKVKMVVKVVVQERALAAAVSLSQVVIRLLMAAVAVVMVVMLEVI
tara:strand:- start:260 stop:490 length:231 start_codon:yes stop_codon:yes gene_type:complete